MKKIYFFIVYIVTILNIASILGMETEQAKNRYSMKKSPGVNKQDLLLTRKITAKEILALKAYKIMYNTQEKSLYFLAQSAIGFLHLFKMKATQKNATPLHIKKFNLQSLLIEDHYFFYRNHNDTQNTIRVDTNIEKSNHFIINHNTPIIKTGKIKEIIYTGSTWPSIYKTVIQGTKKQQSLFMKNAFLLGCKDNCMIIGKVNSKHNSAFFFWRRLKEKNDVNITLYALFAEKPSQEQKDYFDTEIVAALFKQAEDPKNKQDILKKSNITLVKVASHITLTSRDQENPEIYFPKVAISQDKALIVHKDGMQFDNTNPKISIVYKSNTIQENDNQLFNTNAFFMKTFIKKQKSLVGKHIRLPYFNEIKSVYLAIIEQQPMCVMVTKTDRLGYCADGVYILPFTGPIKKFRQQINNPQTDLPYERAEAGAKSAELHKSSYIELLQPLWHVDIQYDNTKSTWKSLEAIIDSTFDFKNNTLFLIVEPKKSSPVNTQSSKETVTKQQLITINLSDFMRDKAIKKENNDV